MIARPPELRSLAEIEARIDATEHAGLAPLAAARELVGLAEEVLEHWIVARGETPTTEQREGSRLLALQRQGARGEPSFNACRETCRELAFAHNCIAAEPEGPAASCSLTSAIMTARHICLFVTGKLQVAGLGEFCCSSKPLRAAGG